MSSRAVVFLALISAVLPYSVQAQLFSYDREAPRATQSLTFVVAPIDFNYRGGGEPTDRFDFDDLARGALYARPNLHVSVLFGTHRPADAPEADALRLIDAALFTWGEIGFSPEGSDGRTRIFIPILLHSSHRRVAAKDEEDTAIDAFSVTVLGLGTGIGFNGHFGPAQLEVRATPVIGLATRSFGDASGSSTLFDGDVMLHFGDLVGRFGLSFGYGFRSQRWNVGSSNLLEDVADDLFDYSGSQHLFRAGISW